MRSRFFEERTHEIDIPAIGLHRDRADRASQGSHRRARGSCSHHHGVRWIRRRRRREPGGHGRARPADLPLRHLRRRSEVDRHAADARGHRQRRRPDDRARRSD